MKTWKKLTAVASVVALSTALAACGGDDGGTEGGGTEGGGTEGGGAEAGGNELTVWTWDPAFNIYAMEQAAEVYKQDHPDFNLTVIETPWDDLQAKLTTLAQSQQFDELPDIFLMQNNAFQKNVINYPDLFTDFSDSGVDFSEFPEGVVEYSVIDGVNYGLPFDNGTAVTALRTDILEEAGFTVEDFTDISWSQFIAQGEEVLAATGKPMLSSQAGSSDLLMMMLQSAGASLFDVDGNPTIADNDALIAAMEIYQELVSTGVLVEVNSWDEYIGTLTGGTVASTINGIWILGSIQTAEDQSGNWQITNLPSLDGVDGATNVSANGGSSWAVSSTGDAALAFDFLNATFAGSTEFYDTILPSSGAIANWMPAGESSVYAEPQEFFGGQPVFQMVLEFSAQVPSNNTGAYYYEGRDSISAAMTQVIGGADITTALADAQSAVEFAMN